MENTVKEKVVFCSQIADIPSIYESSPKIDCPGSTQNPDQLRLRHNEMPPSSSRVSERRLRIETIYRPRIENQTANHPQMKPSDLAQIVGLTYRWNEDAAFIVHAENSKNEKVGTANFKKDKHGALPEEIVWYWSPEHGFRVIATQSEISRTYDKYDVKTPFCFDQIKINDSGITAFSFAFDLRSPTSWCWWELNETLHIAPLTEDSWLLKDIDPNGNILLSGVKKSGELKFATTNIYKMKEINEHVYPFDDINLATKNWMISYCNNHFTENYAELLGIVNSPRNQFLGIRWLNHARYHPSNPVIDGFLENGDILGHAVGYCQLSYSHNPIFKKWPNRPIKVEVNFTISGDIIKVHIIQRKN